MEIENIKFKAKQLNSGKWFEGDLVRLGNTSTTYCSVVLAFVPSSRVFS